LIGFLSIVEDGTLLRAMHFGSSDSSPNDFYSYAMFYVIRLGIEGGHQKVSLGRTATREDDFDASALHSCDYGMS